MNKIPALRFASITRCYASGDENLEVLRDVSFEIWPGETVALVAPSGTGKSTLLHIAGLLDRPQKGKVIIAGRETDHLSDHARTAIRRHEIGFVYQFHHLLAEFTALENVLLPQIVAGKPKQRARERAEEILTQFSLSRRLNHLPGKLSGGERQRVAIARSLANRPKLLLADEPTGNLDSTTSNLVFDALLHAVRAHGAGALIATHNEELAALMDRVLELRNGKISVR